MACTGGEGARRPHRTAARVAAALSTVLVVSGSAFAQGGPPPRPRLTLDGSTVRVTGATPSGKVVLFGVDRVVAGDDYPTVMVTREIEIDDDKDGAVEHALDHAVPPRHVWIAVDLASGEIDVSLPADTGQRLVGWRGRGLRLGQGSHDAVEDANAFTELLLVRSSSGAWGGLVQDGGALDEDRTPNGRFAAPIDGLEPVGGSPPAPLTFARGDLVFAVDPISMMLTVERVVRGPQS
jgi:hypothetical protein